MFMVVGLVAETLTDSDFPVKIPRFHLAPPAVFALVPPELMVNGEPNVKASRLPPLGMSNPQSHGHELSFPSHKANLHHPLRSDVFQGHSPRGVRAECEIANDQRRDRLESVDIESTG